jgi:hypothetical protein
VSATPSTATTGSARPAQVVATWRYVLASTRRRRSRSDCHLLGGDARRPCSGRLLVLDDRGTPHVVRAVDVVVAIWPMVVGVLLAALLGRWRAWLLRAGQAVGGLLALLSVAGPMTG